MPQCPCGLPTAAAVGLAHHRGLSPLSWNQDPRHPHHPLTRGFAPWRQHGWRLDRKTDTPSRPHHLPALGQRLWAKPAPLRSAQTQGPRSAATRWHPICLPADRQRCPGWHSCFCSSTSASAVPWPTAAFTTLPIQFTHPIANSRPPITRLTRRSRTSSTCSQPLDVTASNVEVFLFTIFDPRI